MNNETPITGFTTSIREYTRVEGIILRPAEAIVKYGTIVEIEDNSQGKRYLAMIVNVEEETPHPALDVERLRKLYQSLSETSLQDANRVLLELLSPTHQLIKWSSIMKVELRVLGEITRHNGLERLSPYERPPRPFSSIVEPDPVSLEKIIHYSLGRDYKRRGLYLGKLSLAEKVGVYMNPDKLTTHLSILAQTGGGKTETVKRLVYEVSRRRNHIDKKKGGIIVFDIAGEYTGYPYLRDDTVPLLDAVLQPENYSTGDLPEQTRPKQITIIVPYEAARIGWREQQELIWRGLVDLACKLSSRLRIDMDVLAFYGKERHHAIVRPNCGPGQIPVLDRRTKVKYNEAYKAITQSRFLIIGLPLPSFMDLDTMIEMSGTKSEYFPLIIADIAGSLNLYHGSDIYGISLLSAIASSWDKLKPSFGEEEKRARSILEVFKKKCETRQWDVRDLPRYMSKDLYYSLMRYLAWQAYRGDERTKIADPLEDSETEALCKLLQREDTYNKVLSYLKDLLSYIQSSNYDKGTLASLKRALRKIETFTSDIVDTVVFDKIMDRISHGFTIIHLAPPSSGNVDPLLASIIRRLFYHHVGHYDSERLTVLVVEEAHNLAPAGESKSSKDALLRVAREGRKWGLSMWLVTQRPSFVDSSILSQTATSILLRTTNPEDLASIKRGVESAAAEIIDRLPELEPSRGEALLTGLAAPERRIPLLIMVERLRPVREEQ